MTIKIGAITMVTAALGLWVWQSVGNLPAALSGAAFEKVNEIAHIALIIHAIEGLIAAVLTFQITPVSRTKEAAKAAVYVFFVGTVGLLEIVRSSQKNADKTDLTTG